MWVLGQRVHHGATGILVGVLLMAHDRRDWRQWFARELPPAD